MNTTYVVVAENGIDTFSMKTVTNRLGVSEGLIYKYFDTREGLLFKSFITFQRDITEHIKEETALVIDGESKDARRERIWKSYYRFLLECNYKSLFYFEYRWSYRYNEYLNMSEDGYQSYIEAIEEFSKALLGRSTMTTVDKDVINWIVENTGLYVKKALLGDIEKDEVTAHRIYQMIFFGASALTD